MRNPPGTGRTPTRPSERATPDAEGPFDGGYLGYPPEEYASDLPFGSDRPEQLLEPFCACGRVISRCDGSRRGCGKTPRHSSIRCRAETGQVNHDLCGICRDGAR